MLLFLKDEILRERTQLDGLLVRALFVGTLYSLKLSAAKDDVNAYNRERTILNVG